MTQAESEIVQAFKRELTLALYRITNREISLSARGLPVEIPDTLADSPKNITTSRLRRSRKTLGKGAGHEHRARSV